MSRRKTVPTYRLHKQSGQAIVTLTDGFGGRRDVLLGTYGSSESRAEYARVIAEWEANGRRLNTPVVRGCQDISINELALAYWKYVETYYVKDGEPTSEQETMRQALRPLRRLYGHTLAKDFGPLALKAVRQEMVQHPIVRRVKEINPETGKTSWKEKVLRVGLGRKYINKQIGRIKRMFAWGVEEELVTASVHAALLRVAGLRKGKGQGRETKPVRSVPDAWVEAVLQHVPPIVKAMIQVQRLSGMRPQDVLQMRAVDIDMTGKIWEYRPDRYKTEHHDRERIVFLGPRAQAILKPLLPLAVEAWIFSPNRSEAERNAQRREQRKTPMTPSQAKRRLRKNRRRAPRDHYDIASYRRAITRGCEKAGVPFWHPSQLRHSRGTEIRKHYGLEAAQAVLGHAELAVTQIYAEVDMDTARRVIGEIG